MSDRPLSPWKDLVMALLLMIAAWVFYITGHWIWALCMQFAAGCCVLEAFEIIDGRTKK